MQMKYKITANYKEMGITLIALVVTIIAMLILAGVTLSLTLSDNGILGKAQYGSNTWANATKDETTVMEEMEMLTQRFSYEDIVKVKNRIKNKSIQIDEVDYTPEELYDSEGKKVEITIDGSYNGGLRNQVLSQEDLIGSEDKIKWYVLSINENAVSIVSQPTKAMVEFKDSSGYDNCLYFLNELSTKLFINRKLGITENRVHAFRLSDIKEAAEQANEGTGNWNWNENFIKNATYDGSGNKVWNDGKIGKKVFTPSYKYYPSMYKFDENKEVIMDNQIYDEFPEKLILSDGIKRNTEGFNNPANNFIVNYTYLSYYNQREFMLKNLGTFGELNIAKEIFNPREKNYWLASRCISANSSDATFILRNVYSRLFAKFWEFM